MAQAAGENLVSSWDWANKHVQPRDQASESRFVNGATVLISAGPPRLSGPDGNGQNVETGLNTANQGVGNLVFPIGVCLDASIQQQRQLQRIYEIGSDRSYFIQGRSSGALTLNRVLFNGANMLRVLYAYYTQDVIQQLKEGTQEVPYDSNTTGRPDRSDEVALDKVAAETNSHLMQVTGESVLPEIVMNPGYNNMYMNLASDLFNHPLGLMFMFQDIHKHTFASFYCEMCYVQSHGMQIQANSGSLISESVQMQFDRISPINVVV
jgi:hypothetical protein